MAKEVSKSAACPMESLEPVKVRCPECSNKVRRDVLGVALRRKLLR